MTKEEISKLYTRLAFQYESSIDALLAKGLIDTDLATAMKEKFYDSLNEERLQVSPKIRDNHETVSLYMRQLACKRYGVIDGIGKAIFRRISWTCNSKLDAQPQHIRVSTSMGKNMNREFDDRACEELIPQGHTTSLSITLSL